MNRCRSTTRSAVADHLRLHPWNLSFTWTPSVARSGRLSDDQVEAFDHDGFIVLESAFEADLLAPLVADLDDLETKADAFLREFDDDRISIAESGAIVFGIHPSTQYETARAFVEDPLFADLCHDLVGPDSRLYWDQLVYKSPQKPRRFPWHQDNGYGFVEPQQYLTCWVALTDATVDNGCPWIVPGQHLRGTLAHDFVEPLGFQCMSEHPDARPVPVPAGSIIVFSSLTPHLTGPNVTDAVRKAYIIQYAPDGAEVLRGDPAEGAPTHREPLDDGRQVWILRNGHRV